MYTHIHVHVHIHNQYSRYSSTLTHMYIHVCMCKCIFLFPEPALQPSAGVILTPVVQCAGPHSHIHRPKHDGHVPGSSVQMQLSQYPHLLCLSQPLFPSCIQTCFYQEYSHFAQTGTSTVHVYSVRVNTCTHCTLCCFS